MISFEVEVITPALLVLGHGINLLEPVSLQVNRKKDDLVEYTRLRHDQEEIWSKWPDEDLVLLRAHQWPGTEPPKVGELVIVKDRLLPRRAWKVATIDAVAPEVKK